MVVSDGVDNGRLGAALQDKGLDVETSDFLQARSTRRFTPPGSAGRPQRRRHRARARRRLRLRAHRGHHRSGRARRRARAEAAWNGKTLPVTLRRDGVPVKVAEVNVEPGTDRLKVALQLHARARRQISVRNLDPGARRRSDRREQRARVSAQGHPRQDPRPAGDRPAVVGRALFARPAQARSQRRSGRLLHFAHADRSRSPCRPTSCR